MATKGKAASKPDTGANLGFEAKLWQMADGLVLHGPDLASGEPAAERSDPNYRDVVLERRLRETVEPLVPGDLRFENAEKFVGMGR